MECSEMYEMECNHEEADTRLLLHANHSKETNERIIINSPDTDVFVLSIAMQRIINKEIFFMTGTGNNFRLTSIQAIVEESEENLSQCLLGFHAFTGNSITPMLSIVFFCYDDNKRKNSIL